MTEPRISLLAGDAGRTFASMGLVVIRESKAFFERVVSAPPKGGRRDFEVVNAWEHEFIHFLHSISTSYMYSHAVSTIKYAFNVLDNLQEYLKVKHRPTQFEDIVRSLDARVNSPVAGVPELRPGTLSAELGPEDGAFTHARQPKDPEIERQPTRSGDKY